MTKMHVLIRKRCRSEQVYKGGAGYVGTWNRRQTVSARSKQVPRVHPTELPVSQDIGLVGI